MRSAAAAAALIAFPAALAFAGGGSFSGRNETLSQHCILRQAAFPDPATPEEKRRQKALGKSVTALLKPGLSPAKDLAALAKAAKRLDRAFPGDPEFGADMDAALDGYRADHDDLESRMLLLLDRLPQDEIPRFLAHYYLIRAYHHDDASDGAPTRSERARRLSSAVRVLDKGWKFAFIFAVPSDVKNVVPASAGRASASMGGIPFPPDLLQAEYDPEYGYLFFALVEMTASGGSLNRVIGVTVRGAQGPGVFDIGTTDIGITAPYLGPSGFVLDCQSGPACAGFATEDSGTYTGVLTITTLDLDRRLVEGTFAFMAREKDPSTGTRAVSGGTFRVAYRPVALERVANP